ncbi:hypothetical protein M422DRAFT_268718 [Sphaerobolus stellatus SS14]|uniref:Uncharacterized protein n=1 Tax=Sphaerobolus stellatus (strain SS14) TaxID=990650 RepID=A0A0C9U6F0_SPHS4|nr:hypothetical protein M422DRAFT_268718 [Sphaerobolus stellatus SS14]
MKLGRLLRKHCDPRALRVYSHTYPSRTTTTRSPPLNGQRLTNPNTLFDCIPHLIRLHNLTHVGGFNWDMTSIAGEKKAILEKLPVLTKLEYIGGWGQNSPFGWIASQTLKDESAMENGLKLRHVFSWAIPSI